MADAMSADSTRLVTGGIDTHKDTHVAAVINELGAEIATRAFPTTTAGYRELGRWLGSHGDLDRVGVEGCGSWGAGIARHLTAESVIVVEINRPNRQRHRTQGKSDALDAIAAARSALAGRRPRTVRRHRRVANAYVAGSLREVWHTEDQLMTECGSSSGAC